LLPLIALIDLAGFLYFAFWRELANKPDPNDHDSRDGGVR